MAAAVNPRRLAAIGNYQLSQVVLGEGSYSKVVLANHVVLNKKVALKVMTISQIQEPYVKKNLSREATILSRLNHPRVVPLLEVCSSKDFCLALGISPGGTLHDLVESHPGGRLEEEEARLYFLQLVEGLRYIHGEGIIHRDLKLENIFLNKEKTDVVIGDFGLSNFWHPEGKLGTRCGSAEYAAPEMFDKNVEYNQSVDVWSLGIMLYAMLSGQLPFQAARGENINELIHVINIGLTKQNMDCLGQVSIESKLLITHLLVVDQDLRIDLTEVSKHTWLSKLAVAHMDTAQSFTLSSCMQMEVAKMVQEKLKLHHMTPIQILSYVMSAKGKFGKTAGCFNLLARDLVISSKSGFKKVRVLKLRSPVQIGPAELVDVAEAVEEGAPVQEVRRSGRVRRKNVKYNPDTWDLDTLYELNQEEGNTLDDGAEEVKRESVKSAKNWRRSIMPVTGQRIARLKRVDFDVEQEEAVRTLFSDMQI